MSRKRLALTIAAIGAGIVLLAAAAILILVQTPWFSDQVRARIVSAVEDATGGRAEAGSFDFDWRQLRAQVGDFAIHGSEPAGKPPLFHAQSIRVGLKIVSFLRRKVDVQSVDIVGPEVYLTVGPDGKTNIPAPRIRGRNNQNALETILDASIGRFSVTNGIFEIESRSRTPFSAQGRNLQARFDYEVAGPRYRGDLRMRLSNLQLEDYEPTDVDIASKLVIEKNRIAFSQLTFHTGESHFELAGALENLNSPRVSAQYTATVSQNDVARFLRTKLLESGTVRVAGEAHWAGSNDFGIRGNLNGYGIEYRDSYVRLTDFRADGALAGGPRGIEVTGLRLSGSYVRPGKRIPADVRIRAAAIHTHRIDFRGLAVSIFGGMFEGNGTLDDLDHFQASGDVTGFQARRVVAVYSDAPLPWDGRASGPVQIDARIKRNNGISLGANLAVAPESGSAPVSGQIMASYDSRTKLLDLGRSSLSLPSSRVNFSGVIGRELRAHFESRNLADILPAIGVQPESVPLTFGRGSVVFDGAVSGPLSDPRIAGKLSASDFIFDGNRYDSFTADTLASPANAALNNAALTSGGVRLQFQGAVQLTHWKPEPANDVFANGTIRNAPSTELMELLGWHQAPLQGTTNAAIQLTGSVSKPVLQGPVEVNRGRFQQEPFDRFEGNVRYVEHTLELTGGQISAGAKQVKLAASYRHDPNSFRYGKLTFDIVTNSMPLEQIRALQDFRPGFKGTVQATSNGVIELRPERKGERGFAITALRSDINGADLEFEGKVIGSARITATSDGRAMHATVEAGLVESAVRGEGVWQLQGDYPGKASVRFARLSIARLGNFISPRKKPGPAPYEGSADGEISLEGPALRPEQVKARLTVARLQLAPASEGAPAGRATPLVIRNEGPVVATLAGKVVSVERAHLVGRATDVTLAGKIALEKSGFDLRANGRVDLGILEDFSSDLTSAGTLNVNATLRGPLESPQVGGRAEVQGASLTVESLPNSFTAANGVILFNGDRATIQNLRGESGGGVVEISGSVAYNEGQLIFYLDLDGRNVRVRYPEGISTVSNARLNLRGTSERSMLSGNLTILRTGVNLESDFGSVLARSAEPVETPPARTGILGGMNLDVSIASAPDVEVRSSMTQDIAAEANLRLRGTATNPVLQGRVNILQGQVLFLGAKYNVSRGSIEFYNPVRIEPVLNLDLETKAKGVDITLTLSGPVKKLNLTPRSDPPLPLNDILSLLATGQTPSSDTALAQRSSSAMPWQQMGATALLGQVITSPVAGRLQRFFGVSRLRIDPSLPGVENNPQARFTVEQQITSDITFTYITVVNSSNPQVVRMEWDFSKQWSVVALREENGRFGMDFFYKRQFK